MTVEMRQFMEAAGQLRESLILWRRDFHMHPEIGMDLPRTAAVVAEVLRGLELPVQTGVGQSGVVAIIEGAQPGPVVLLRFDMDALPIQEETGAEYTSLNPGAMHACGHDAHTAIGLGVATILSQAKDNMQGTVKLVFQPGEEGYDGAESMIAEGVLENPAPDYALALHVWNSNPVGWVGLTAGPAMAGSEHIVIELTGRGGHAAAPHMTIDPVVAAAQIVTALQSVVARNVDPMESAVVSITEIKAGSIFNIIPEKVIMCGTVRTFTEVTRRIVLTRIREICECVAQGFGCDVIIKLDTITKPLINDPALTAALQRMIPELITDVELETNCRVMVSEDMANFLERVPGSFFFMGSNNPEKGLDAAHHNPLFDIDEEVLPLGVGVICEAAWQILTGELFV